MPIVFIDMLLNYTYLQLHSSQYKVLILHQKEKNVNVILNSMSLKRKKICILLNCRLCVL